MNMIHLITPYPIHNIMATFSVTRSSLFADRCLLHVGLKIIFWQWLDTITGQRNFCSIKSCFLTGQNFKKSEPILVMSNFVFVNVIVLLQGDKMQDLQVKSCLFKRKSLRDWLIRLASVGHCLLTVPFEPCKWRMKTHGGLLNQI